MSNADLYQYRYCWPSGDWGSLPIEGGIEVAYRAELGEVPDTVTDVFFRLAGRSLREGSE